MEEEFLKKLHNIKDAVEKEKFIKDFAKAEGIGITALRGIIRENEDKRKYLEQVEKENLYMKVINNLISEAKRGEISGVPTFFDLMAGKYLTIDEDRRYDDAGRELETRKKVDFRDKNTTSRMIEQIVKSRAKKLIERDDLSEIIGWLPACTKIYDPHQKPGIVDKNKSGHLINNMCSLPNHYMELKKDTHRLAKVERRVIMDSIKIDNPAIYTLLKNLFVQDEYIDYMINWLGYIVQNLNKTRNAIVVLGEQGTGKGVFWDNIVRWIFGGDNCVTVGNSDIRSDFNAIFDNRLFVNFNEIKGDFRDGNIIYETLKGYISDDRFIVNTKNVSQYEVVNRFNSMFFSNHEVPLQIGTGDRRYSVFKTAKKKLKDIVGDTGAFIEKVIEEREGFLRSLFLLEVDEAYALSLIETDQKAKIQELSNTLRDNVKENVEKKNEDYFIDKIEEALDGKMDDHAIKEISKDGVETYEETNKDMLNELYANIIYGVYSVKVLNWYYRVCISDKDSTNVVSRFWDYVFDRSGRVGKDRIRVRYTKEASTCILWGKAYTLIEENGKEKWTRAGDSLELTQIRYEYDNDTNTNEQLPF